MRDAQSAARLATHTVDLLRAELTSVKQSRDQLDADLTQTRQIVKDRTESLVQCHEQTLAVEVCDYHVPDAVVFNAN